MKSVTKPRSALSLQVVKAMGLFGGVQLSTILCGMVRVKLVALWIGAAGVGIFGLYNTAIDMIGAITRLSLRNSSVRDLSAANGSSYMAVLITIVRRWAWALGLIGAMAMLAMSPLLSQWTFGDDSHAWGFMLVSVAVLIQSVCEGEAAILQGRNLLRRLANAYTWSVVIGLIVSVPMYRVWGEASIAPSIVVYNVAMFITVMLMRDRSSRPQESVSLHRTVADGRGFVVLGIYMTVSAFVIYLIDYVFKAYLTHVADVDTLGYYQSGYTLVNRYVGMVFTAIAVEFYPRLSRCVKSNRHTSTIVSHEMSIVLWVLMPIIAIFIAADKLIVSLLYTDDFMVILPFITWAMVGIVLRGVSWCMSYVILARGDGPIFLLTETVSGVVCLLLNISGYHYYGYMGLGLSYAAWYMLYTVMMWGVYRYRYGLTLGRGIAMLTGLVLCTTAVCIVVRNYFDCWWAAAAIGALSLVGTYRHVLRR
jgi:PST family polysaccharide transporter